MHSLHKRYHRLPWHSQFGSASEKQAQDHRVQNSVSLSLQHQRDGFCQYPLSVVWRGARIPLNDYPYAYRVLYLQSYTVGVKIYAHRVQTAPAMGQNVSDLPTLCIQHFRHPSELSPYIPKRIASAYRSVKHQPPDSPTVLTALAISFSIPFQVSHRPCSHAIVA